MKRIASSDALPFEVTPALGATHCTSGGAHQSNDAGRTRARRGTTRRGRWRGLRRSSPTRRPWTFQLLASQSPFHQLGKPDVPRLAGVELTPSVRAGQQRQQHQLRQMPQWRFAGQPSVGDRPKPRLEL